MGTNYSRLSFYRIPEAPTKANHLDDIDCRERRHRRPHQALASKFSGYRLVLLTDQLRVHYKFKRIEILRNAPQTIAGFFF